MPDLVILDLIGHLAIMSTDLQFHSTSYNFTQTNRNIMMYTFFW